MIEDTIVVSRFVALAHSTCHVESQFLADVASLSISFFSSPFARQFSLLRLKLIGPLELLNSHDVFTVWTYLDFRGRWIHQPDLISTMKLLAPLVGARAFHDWASSLNLLLLPLPSDRVSQEHGAGAGADGATKGASPRISLVPIKAATSSFVDSNRNSRSDFAQVHRHVSSSRGGNIFMFGWKLIEFMFDMVISCLFVLPAAALKASMKTRLLLPLTVLGALLQPAAARVNIDLTRFESGTGVRYHGATSGTNTGFSIAMIGDHNGDGFQDYMFSSNTLLRAIIVMKKDTTYTPTTTDAIVSGQYFRVIKGPTGTQTGNIVGGLGDINGDGFDDVIVGGVNGEVAGRSRAGYAFVIFGRVGPFTDVTVTGTWNAPTIGFMIFAPEASSGFIQNTRTCRGLGDVNGDGVDDFAITAKRYAGTTAKSAAGVVYVIFGKTSSAFTNIDLLPANFENNGIYFTGEAASDELGVDIMPAGDFNGDGIPDILMGALQFDPFVTSMRTGAGAAYLIYGSNSTLISTDLSTFVTGVRGFRILGANGNDQFGRAHSGVGDVNGDGLDDIAIGAPNADPLSRSNAGAVYVIFGTRSVFSTDYDMKVFNNFQHGFAIYGHVFDTKLSNVAPAGDINRDGVDDIVVGGFSLDSVVTIVYGQTAVRTTHVDTRTAPVTTFNYTSGAYIGFTLDGGKDVNGDGIPDLLLGGYAAKVTPEGGGAEINNAGAMWMLPGPFILPTPTAIPTFSPTVVPTAVPSANPSAAPSANPSQSPTAVPSPLSTLPPTKSPTLDPTAAPTLFSTINPSAVPTLVPSLTPSANPTLSPTVAPTTMPTVVPTVPPSPLPSAYPTLNPTSAPTIVPTLVPTMVPSCVPSARPTVPAAKNFELTVDVEQEVFFVEKDDYDSQEAVYNTTIQHTVADSMDGVVPERVTEITVEEEEEEGGRVRGFRGDSVVARVSTVGSVTLRYKVTVFDPLLTVNELRTQLVQAAREGRMDAALRTYAAQFGASGLNNGTFAEPQVTSAAVQRDVSGQLTGVQIALLVIGTLLTVAFVAAGCWWMVSPRFRMTQKDSVV